MIVNPFNNLIADLQLLELYFAIYFNQTSLHKQQIIMTESEKRHADHEDDDDHRPAKRERGPLVQLRILLPSAVSLNSFNTHTKLLFRF